MPQIYLQRNQLKYTKKQYRVRNWREYEAGLCKRGDLTIWFSEDAVRDWHPSVGAKPGGQCRYSDTAIEAVLTVRAFYGLALRQTEGFLRSVARLLQLDIEIPDHSTLSRRSATLRGLERNTGSADGPVHILIDSTGLKAHRGSTAPADRRNRRTWRKLHLVVDVTTTEILTSKITTHGTRDSTPVRDKITRHPTPVWNGVMQQGPFPDTQPETADLIGIPGSSPCAGELHELTVHLNADRNKARLIPGNCGDWKGKKNTTVKDIRMLQFDFARRWNFDTD